MTRKILVTSALPYANGQIHLGHMVEHVQTDIWVRFQKMRGNQCLYICGEDTHGTAVMISAEKRGVAPEELIKEIYQQHLADFLDFHIAYDNYYTTHSEENKALAREIYLRLQQRGDIITRKIKQAFDSEKNMFLPDRYLKGECPSCGASDQYGDNCEACGAHYSPTELKNPISTLSGTTPQWRESEHYFFDLPKHAPLLQQWIKSDRLQTQVGNKLQEWFDAGLQQWDISRDAPYFGIQIPGTDNKYFYVWLDAPIGYMASFKNFCDNNPGVNFDDYWQKNSDAELYHFIGKDIIYFHALFWPAMLEGANFRTPSAVYAHGFLTVDGKKMSKSRGTFIPARTYLDNLNPEYLRYYFAAKLSDSIDDIDLNLEDFMQRVNADLVGKVVNIASRCAGFINKHFASTLSDHLADPTLYQQFVDAGKSIAENFESRNYSRAVRTIMELADKANAYIDEKKPWQLIKSDNAAQTQTICSQGINFFRVLMIYLKPILPVTAQATEEFLNIGSLTWNDAEQPLLNHIINPFKPLMQRIQAEQIEAMKQQALQP